ncbi:MAG: hypothetical protein M5U28_53530 [Sandaracinaceae bacterium]|nr:hypothetical protein [Sandaracinaceae bacterium]
MGAPPRSPLAWVLNLDAELELAAGGAYTASAGVRRAMEAARAALRRALPPADVVLDLDEEARARGLEGRCWCPTPRALARLALAGARVPDAPPSEVLERANERGFGFAIEHLEGAVRCASERDALAAVEREGRWIVKRGLAFAGARAAQDRRQGDLGRRPRLDPRRPSRRRRVRRAAGGDRARGGAARARAPRRIRRARHAGGPRSSSTARGEGAASHLRESSRPTRRPD